MVQYFWLLVWHLLASSICLSLTYHQVLAMLLVDYFVLLNIYMYMLSCFSHVWVFATLWTMACQAPLSMGFSRREYWSELPCPPPGDLPNPGITAASLASPALAGGFWSLVPPRIHMCLLIENYLLIENWTHVSCVSCIASRFSITEPPGSPTCVYIYVCAYTHTGDVRDAGLIPGSWRSPGGGQGNPLQYSCLKNPMDRGAWQAIGHRVTRSQIRLKWLSMHACIYIYLGLPWWLSAKGSTCWCRDVGSTPGSGRSPGEGNGNPLQYSCLENPMDRGAWWATVHGVTKSQTRLSN